MKRAVCLVLLSATACTSVCNETERVRLSWDMMKATGASALYAQAVQKAVSEGYQEMFSNVHNEQGQNINEAHNSAGFIIWHRRYLLAYENMLRSLDPAFECLTLPYWNYFSHYEHMPQNPQEGDALRVAAIMREMPQGDASRSSWHLKRGFPSSASIAYLTDRLNVDTYQDVARNIEYSFHNSIHGWLRGSMGSYHSPRDPIFYAHHATVDLAHAIYFDCKAGRGLKTDEFKRKDPVSYVPYGSRSPDIDGGFHMYYRNNGQSIPVEEIDRLRPFFQDLPQHYYEYVDTRDMGNVSYRYELDPLLQSTLTSMECVQDEEDEVEIGLPIISNTKTRAVLQWRDLVGLFLKDMNIQDSKEISHQIKIMHCVMHAERFGLTDYTAEFRRNFNLTSDDHDACISTVQQYKDAMEHNTSILTLDEPTWRNIYRTFFQP